MIPLIIKSLENIQAGTAEVESLGFDFYSTWEPICQPIHALWRLVEGMRHLDPRPGTLLLSGLHKPELLPLPTPPRPLGLGRAHTDASLCGRLQYRPGTPPPGDLPLCSPQCTASVLSQRETLPPVSGLTAANTQVERQGAVPEDPARSQK